MTTKKTIKPSGDVTSVNVSTGFVEGKDYFLYDRSKTKKQPLLYSSLLAQAKDFIAIWDPHYEENCGRLFCDMKNDGIVVEVLTICKGRESRKDIQIFANTILSAINKTDVPNCTVIVNALKWDYNERFTWATNWHDRFLIIDDDVYLVGTSMDAQSSRSDTFGIMRVAENKDKNLIRDTYISYRDQVIDESTSRGNGFKCTAKRGYVV